MVDPTLPDEELARLWQKTPGREDVFELLVYRYQTELAGFFRGMRFDDEDCRDLAQETFVQVFRGLADFRHGASLHTWLYEIARNAAYKRLRGQRTQKRTGHELPLDEITGEERELAEDPRQRSAPREAALDALLSEEERRQVRVVVDELAPEDRNMVLFRIWQELSVRETSLAMNKPEGTVKSGWSRICATLSKKLGSQLWDLPP